MTVGAVRSKTSSSEATNGGVAGFITVIIIWVLTAGFGLEVDPQVAAAITGLAMYVTGKWLT